MSVHYRWDKSFLPKTLHELEQVLPQLSPGVPAFLVMILSQVAKPRLMLFSQTNLMV